MIIFLKLRTIVLGFVLSGAVALAAAAQEAETPEADQSDQNFSLDEAVVERLKAQYEDEEG